MDQFGHAVIAKGAIEVRSFLVPGTEWRSGGADPVIAPCLLHVMAGITCCLFIVLFLKLLSDPVPNTKRPDIFPIEIPRTTPFGTFNGERLKKMLPTGLLKEPKYKEAKYVGQNLPKQTFH